MVTKSILNTESRLQSECTCKNVYKSYMALSLHPLYVDQYIDHEKLINIQNLPEGVGTRVSFILVSEIRIIYINDLYWLHYMLSPDITVFLLLKNGEQPFSIQCLKNQSPSRHLALRISHFLICNYASKYSSNILYILFALKLWHTSYIFNSRSVELWN